MTRLSRVLQMTVTVFAVCLVATAPAHADISNGDFSAGDDFWSVPGKDEDWDYDTHATPEGGVIDDAYWVGPGGEEDRKVVGFDGFVATLEESPRYVHSTALGDASFTRIQQAVTLLEGETTLRFDFEVSGGGYESDYFDVFLTDLLGTTTPFDIVSSHETGGSTVSDVAMLPVFDLPRGDYLLTFQITGYDDGPDFDPMFVQIDNVSFVPLPGAALLGGLGLCTAGWFCRRERRA